MIRYGKSCAPIFTHKINFFNDNERMLWKIKIHAQKYKEQPRREYCKVCGTPLSGVDFEKYGVGYVACRHCGHLNGCHEDTEEFNTWIYTGEQASYADTYKAPSKAAYDKRLEDIYTPKASFLIESLEEQGEKPSELSYVDWGAGSGYFVGALQRFGLTKAEGYEVSEPQVTHGNEMLGTNSLKMIPMDNLKLLSQLDANVVSLIGVLEHVNDPNALLQSVASNASTQYLFLSVPCYSMSVFIEILFQNVVPRHLAPTHTHLYTEQSIDYICNKFGWERVSEWWFGSDVMDLYRSFLISLKAKGCSSTSMDFFSSQIKQCIDSMQLGLDRKKMASEVHMLLKKRPCA